MQYNAQVDGQLGGRSGTQLAPVPPVGGLAAIGRLNNNTGQAFSGTIYEFYYSTNDATSAALTALYTAALANE